MPTKTKTQPAGQKTTSRQPATKQPATTKAKVQGRKSTTTKGDANVVTVKEIAAKVNMTPKSLRAAIRRMNGGPNPVGKGSRYSWPSFSHPDVKQIIAHVTKEDKGKAKGDKKVEA